MQSEASEAYPETSLDHQFSPLPSPSQHGLSNEYHPDPLSPFQDEQSGTDDRSGSEWSLSASPSASPSELDETRLNLLELISSRRLLTLDGDHETANTRTWISPSQSAGSKRNRKPKGDSSPLQDFPEELLFHVISHLPAQDLLTVKLVSRRFYNLVNSPHAWMHAFSKFFPGPDAMRATADTASSVVDADLRSLKRSFTRLTPSPKASWTTEYLLRTRVLRCLARGRPAMPCASPAPGRPGKGMATFTFNSRLTSPVSNLHAVFGDVLDKRKPQFIHGSVKGSITSSDKKGKFDSWGSSEGIPFRHFTDLYPESSMFGRGSGDVVGSTNSMDVSQPFGMVYGEGLPGGCICFWPTGQRHLMFLAPTLNAANHDLGIPRVISSRSSICSAWIAKTTALPKISQSLVGILTGSSDGIVSIYSLGSPGNQIQRLSRGQVTARFPVCPGVPIIAIAADDSYSEERYRNGRIWAVVLNALGEVFYLKDLPSQASLVNYSEEMLDRDREAQAWQTGRTVIWHLVLPSERIVRQHAQFTGDYLTQAVRSGKPHDETSDSLRHMESWFSKNPIDIQADFEGWEMRRYLTVDFGADDGRLGGEVVLVTDRGAAEGQSASIGRYTRSTLRLNDGSTDSVNSELATESNQQSKSLFGQSKWSFSQAQDTLAIREKSTGLSLHASTNVDEWRSSSLIFTRYKNITVQATAIDMSDYALTTIAEDNYARSQAFLRGQMGKDAALDDYDATKCPGQRARFFAVGTGAGTVFIWNARAASSNTTNIVNAIRPIRIIHTQSPSITSLALTSLYLVHGGSEGLVQAWDPLASTLEPIRTLTSRNTLNVRRRAVIASQQNPFATQDPNAYAATAISLDPRPTVLRGIVAIGSYLRYWSFSSAALADDIGKTQKRRKRANRGLNASSPGVDYISGRRAGLKGLVNEEMASRALDEKQRKAEEKQDRVVAKRFGMDLLGEDATEEELLAYAKLLSEEDQERKMSLPLHTGVLRKDATEEEVEAYKSTLNDDELEEWKFASWDKRFGMPASDVASTPRVASTPTRPSTSAEDYDVATAIQRSLADTSPSPASSVVAGPAFTRSSILDANDDDIDRAIQLSLQDNKSGASPPSSPPSSYAQRASRATSLSTAASQSQSEDADIAEAIRRSLQSPLDSTVTSGTSSPSRNDEDFPALSSPTPSKDNRGSEKGRGGTSKGKGRSMW